MYLFLPSRFHAVFVFLWAIEKRASVSEERLSSSGDEIPLLRAETVAAAKSAHTHVACIARYVAYSLWLSDVLNWSNNVSF